MAFKTGAVQLVNSRNLADKGNYKWNFSSCPIHTLEFSANGDYLAFADESFSVGIFRRGAISAGILMNDAPQQKQQSEWEFVGKYKAHYKTIVGTLFCIIVGVGYECR